MTTLTSDEQTRLIADEERNQAPLHTRSNTSTTSTGVPTPLPWRPLLVLLSLNAMQPVAFKIVFPFVNQMILEIGVVTDPEQVGFYSGLIESIMSCMSFITILPCSALADRVGRKPVILVGMLGLAVSVVCFGMSKSYLAMVLSRCIGGTLGGSWACIKIMIGEMTDRSNQGAAFSASAIAFKIGQIVGFPLGGMLAHPERNFPLFQTPFWYAYPFALPCFVAGALCLCAVVMGYFSLPETLRSKHTERANGTTYGTVCSAPVLDSSPPPSGVPHADDNLPERTVRHTYKTILTPSIISLLCSNMAMCLASEALFSVFPLFSFTPVSSGGLGMGEAAIGTQMGIRAILSISTMGFFSPLQRRFGTVRMYQLSMWASPVVTLCFPLLNFLARERSTDGWLFMGTFCIFFLVWSICGFGWTAMAVLVTDYTPSADSLATMNGVSQMSVVLPQAIAPAFVTSLFAASIKSGVVGGNLVWIIMFIMTTAGAMHSMTLREPDTDWRQK